MYAKRVSLFISSKFFADSKDVQDVEIELHSILLSDKAEFDVASCVTV